MTPTEYLNALLKSQNLEEGSTEIKDLRKHRGEVETLIRAKFPSPTIRYGGSKAKGTMIRDSYDLDLPCYFSNDDTSAGDTLEEIFESVKAALAQDYWVEVKASALRLRSKDMKTDFHIDVVPGRFTDDAEADALERPSDRQAQRPRRPAPAAPREPPGGDGREDRRDDHVELGHRGGERGHHRPS